MFEGIHSVSPTFVKFHISYLGGVGGQLGQLPLTITQRAGGPSLNPAGDAVVVESVVAHSPPNLAVICLRANLVCLAVNAQIRNVILANGAVLDLDVPAPHADSVMLLGLHHALAAVRAELGVGGGGGVGGRGHDTTGFCVVFEVLLWIRQRREVKEDEWCNTAAR